MAEPNFARELSHGRAWVSSPSHWSIRHPCQYHAMSAKGVKRASPGASIEKNPLGDVELTDEDAQKLSGIQKEIARTELLLGTC